MTNVLDVLLVEDNPGDVRLTLEVLRESRVATDVTVAGDGDEAMAFLRAEGEHATRRRPSLVLLDLNLPRKSGLEVLAEVKSDRELRRVPVVVLSGSSATHDVVRAYDLHANAYVTKPLDLNEFIAALRAVEGFWLDLATLPPT
jgi:two-component system, chemotaxis family, response regulator Rcp1